MGQPAQFISGLASHPQQLGTKYGQPPAQTQPPVGYTYETFQTPGTSSKPSSAHPSSKPVSMASSPSGTPRSRDYVTDADTTMEDADPYNRAKYQSRPAHHNRASSQFLNQAEESSAARRYSPMNVLSPPMSYPTSPGKPQGSFGSPAAPGQTRRSPARAADYASPPQGYQSSPCESLLFQCDCGRVRLSRIGLLIHLVVFPQRPTALLVHPLFRQPTSTWISTIRPPPPHT